jgi:hypothetical protein
MASERIERSAYVAGAWSPSPTGTHITLPLDPSQYNDAAVEAAALAIYSTEPDPSASMANDPSQTANRTMRRMARAALAAYAKAMWREVRDA